MGKFFNKVVMHLKRIPVTRDLELMRRKYNQELKEEAKPVPSTPIKKVDGWAKAREAKAKKREVKDVKIVCSTESTEEGLVPTDGGDTKEASLGVRAKP